MRTCLWLWLAGCSDPGALTINNTDPSAVIDVPGDGDVIAAGLPLLLEGTVGDAETPETDLIVEWRMNGDTVCSDPANAFGETSCEVQPPGGAVTFTLQVADGQGGIAAAEVEVSASRCFDDDDVLADPAFTQAFGTLNGDDLDVGGQLQDNYRFEALAGDERGFHAFSDAFDARLELYDADCERIAAAEDGARGSNAYTSLRIPADGTYTVVIGATSGGSGDYVLEILDTSEPLGGGCSRETATIDLLSPPYSDSIDGALQSTDQLWPPSVGTNFYFDDIEAWSFYGDRVTYTLTSTAFTPVLSVFTHNAATGGCTLNVYDANDDQDDVATATIDVDRTGITVLAPWGRFSNSLGAYTLTGAATF